MSLDVLAFGAHPDDVEIWCGGLLLKLNDRGYRTGIVDLTVGDMGSRGTPEVRRQELMAAGDALNLDHVEVLDFQDCRVTDDFPGRLKIAAVVRRLRPTLVLAPYWGGPPGRGIGHTDHQAAGYLVSHGVNFAHLGALPLDGEPHAVSTIFYYLFPHEMQPTFVVDISDYVDRWVEVLKCHHSQFYNPRTQRYDAIERFLALAQARGFARGIRYAQAFILPELLIIDDPMLLVAQQGRQPHNPSSGRWSNQ
ncbi:MAG: PIG-L family deacetylase [Nitrospinae bacterium]|nr:PIG-L family deacetylase [Nitrospinota bacterium]